MSEIECSQEINVAEVKRDRSVIEDEVREVREEREPDDAEPFRSR